MALAILRAGKLGDAIAARRGGLPSTRLARGAPQFDATPLVRAGRQPLAGVPRSNARCRSLDRARLRLPRLVALALRASREVRESGDSPNDRGLRVLRPDNRPTRRACRGASLRPAGGDARTGLALALAGADRDGHADFGPLAHRRGGIPRSAGESRPTRLLDVDQRPSQRKSSARGGDAHHRRRQSSRCPARRPLSGD